MSAPSIWVLADPRAGTANQALGIAERLGEPFEVKRLEFSRLAGLPNWLLGPSLAGLRTPGWRPPWPRLVIAAGRRSAPAALWLKRHHGTRLVHVMRPGFPLDEFNLVVLPKHDRAPAAPNVLEILGAPHRVTPEALAPYAHGFWQMPCPRVALLVGGPVRGEGLAPAAAGALAARVAALAGTVLATTSRRTGPAATEAIRAALAGTSFVLHAFGDPGPNQYLPMLAGADVIVATGDSISMISEAAMTKAPLYIADLPDASGPRHRAFHESLYAAGQARPLGTTLEAFARAPLDETARVADAVRAMLGLPKLDRTPKPWRLSDSPALRDAVSRGDHAGARMLLEAGAQLRRDESGIADPTALADAARAGDLEMVTLLLQAGAAVNVRCSGCDHHLTHYFTALHDAVISGTLPVVKALVEAGADINAEHEHVVHLFEDGEPLHTPLGLAIRHKHPEIEAYLRSLGALPFLEGWDQ